MTTAHKRGRPLKFGRPTTLVTMSLPGDVLEWLRTIHPDPAWAVVKLFDRASTKSDKARSGRLADLVQLPGGRALILIKPEPFQHLNRVSIIPLADGRGFLALEDGLGVAHLELAVVDRRRRKDRCFCLQELRSKEGIVDDERLCRRPQQ